MNNPRITKKERGLLKGAIRRVFSRSELRSAVIQASVVKHSDPSRPKVKTWCRCNICGKPEAKSYCVVDHISPVVPVNTSFEEMSLDTVVDRMWCEKNNLQVVDPVCHDKKTKEERQQRKRSKR